MYLCPRFSLSWNTRTKIHDNDDIVDDFRNFLHEVCWCIFALVFQLREIPDIVDCVCLDIEVQDKFHFDIGPGRNVYVQCISGMIKPVNHFASESQFEVTSCCFIFPSIGSTCNSDSVQQEFGTDVVQCWVSIKEGNVCFQITKCRSQLIHIDERLSWCSGLCRCRRCFSILYFALSQFRDLLLCCSFGSVRGWFNFTFINLHFNKKV